MKVEAEWLDNAAFNVSTGSGHEITVDGPPEGGGENRGSRPMELLLVGLACCSAYDVVSILQKSRQELQSCRVQVSAERAATVPKIFTAIHLHFVVKGKVGKAQLERALKLSAEKYCSASIMLGKAAKITHDYELSE
ncbi:MAG: OsmC family protein [Candidatus Porifericomitaceae bacterium WSBS_2022_MAG_OTU9]